MHKAASLLHYFALISTERKVRQAPAGSQLGDQNPGAGSLFSWQLGAALGSKAHVTASVGKLAVSSGPVV